jgi:hypothetical protein
MLRDTRRDNAYFDKWIDFRQNTINEKRGTIESTPLPEGKAGRASRLFDHAMKICNMKS